MIYSTTSRRHIDNNFITFQRYTSPSIPESSESDNRSWQISRSSSRISDGRKSGGDGAHPEGDERPYINIYTYVHNTYVPLQ